MNKYIVKTPKDLEELGYPYDRLYDILSEVIKTKNEELKTQKILDIISLTNGIIKKDLRNITGHAHTIETIWDTITTTKRYLNFSISEKHIAILFCSIYFVIRCVGSQILKDRCLTRIKKVSTKAQENKNIFKIFEEAAKKEEGIMPDMHKILIFKAIINQYVLDSNSPIKEDYIRFFHKFTGIDTAYIRKHFNDVEWEEKTTKKIFEKWYHIFPKLIQYEQ